jgi:CheY-like chemotaxis protein
MAEPISVLIVEDEPLIRMNIVAVFEAEGFQVHEAPGAAAALALLYSHVAVDAMFTDVDLDGGMDGLTLAAAVRDEWPDIKIVVASGVRRVSPREVPDGKFFVKPYNPDTIVATIRELVEA